MQPIDWYRTVGNKSVYLRKHFYIFHNNFKTEIISVNGEITYK